VRVTTIDTPTFEETIIDISTTESELQAYKVLAESYDLLANLTDQTQDKRLEYNHTARMFEQKAAECEQVIDILYSWKAQSEKKDAEIEQLKEAIDISHAVYDRLLADYQALLKESEEE